MKEIECDVRQGTRADAVWWSCGANQWHGLRRTNADKRRAVETALRLIANGFNDIPKGADSNRGIAAHVGVSDPFVATMRAEVLTVSTSKPAPRTGRDGKQYPVQPPKPRPEPVKVAPVVEDYGDEDDGGDADEAPVPCLRSRAWQTAGRGVNEH